MNHRAKLRKIIVGVVVVLISYTGSYFPLSKNGGWVVSESGRNRITLAMADIFEWQPRYGYFHRMRSIGGGTNTHADVIGWFYAPLIVIDQKWIHPTIPFIGESFKAIEPLPAPPLKDYHPTRSNRFHGRFPYEQPETPDGPNRVGTGIEPAPPTPPAIRVRSTAVPVVWLPTNG